MPTVDELIDQQLAAKYGQVSTSIIQEPSPTISIDNSIDNSIDRQLAAKYGQPDEPIYKRPTNKGLDFLANTAKIYPVADTAVNLLYNMLVTFPAQMGAFVGGAATDIGEGLAGEKMDLDKARKYFEEVGSFLAIQPFTRAGKEYSQAIFGTLDEYARRAGEYAVDKTDSPFLGALTYATAQVLPFVLVGGTVRAMRNRGKVPPPNVAYDTVRADMIELFKKAAEKGDKNAIKLIKDINDLHPDTAATIPIDKVIDFNKIKYDILGKDTVSTINNIIEYGPEKYGIDPHMMDNAVRFMAKDHIAEMQKNLGPQDNIYKPQPLEVDLFELDYKTAMTDIAPPGPQKFSVGSLTKIAKGKGIDVAQRVSADGGVEFLVKDSFGDTWNFRDLPSANEFVKRYTGHQAKAYVDYYELMEKQKRLHDYGKIADIAEGEYKKAVGKRFKITEEMKLETDNAILPKEGSQVPQPDTVKMESYNELYGKKPLEKTGLMKYFEPIKRVFDDIEARIGLPLHKLFEAAQKGIYDEVHYAMPYLRRLDKAFKGVNLESTKKIYKLMEQAGIDEKLPYAEIMKQVRKNPELSKKFDTLTARELESAKQTHEILHESGLEFGIPIYDMLVDYAPRMKASNMRSWTEAINEWNLPKEYKWAAEEQRQGYLMPHEESIYMAAKNYILRGARKRYLGDTIEEITKMYEEATKTGAVKSLTRPEADIVNKFISDLRGWSTSFDTAAEITGSNLVKMINKLIPKERFENIEYRAVKKVGVKDGRKVVYQEWEEVSRAPGYFETTGIVRKLVDFHLGLTYSGAMGFRPVTVVRNLMQSMLSLPVLGPKYWAKGVKKALTMEGMAEAKSNRILMNDYLPVGGEYAPVKGAVSQMARAGLWGFRKVDAFNRAVAYHGMKMKVNDLGTAWLKKVSGTKDRAIINEATKKYIRDVDMDFFHRTLIDSEVLPLLEKKDIVGLSERMGKHMAENTQWNYRRANSPYWMKGNMGRVLGQFGTWPTWYLDYMRSLGRGSKRNAAKRIAIFTAQGLAMEQIGEQVFGVDIKKWFLYHPLSWAGSPVIGALSSAKDVAMGTEYEKQKGINQLKQVGLLYAPYSLAIKSIMDSNDYYKEEDKFKKALGFRPSE